MLALVYAAVQLVGMSLYGIDDLDAQRRRVRRVLRASSRMLSPLHWQRPHAVTCAARWPARPALDPVPGTVALLCVMIGTTSFDGLSQGALWTGPDGLAQRLQRRASSTWASAQQTALEIAFTIGLLAMVLVVAGLLPARRAAGMRTVAGSGQTPTELSRRFVHSLDPDRASPTSSRTTSRC